MSFECISAGILVSDHLCSPIPRMPKSGELVLCDQQPLTIGGCAANVAVDLTRLGIRVAVSGCVGEDVFGRFIVDELQRQGVDTSRIRTAEDFSTSGSLIINVEGEDRRFITTIGANAAFEPSHITLDDVLAAKVLYIGGYLFMPQMETVGLVDLFRQARAAGVKTVLDVVTPGRGDFWPRLEPLLVETDVFLPNEDEAASITGLRDPFDMAKRFQDAGAKTVVITQGEKGVVLLNDGIRLRGGVYPVDYVGGTGSGDAFDAGYIMGLLAGCDPQDCLRWGSAIGASCVRSISASGSVFSRAEAEAFMRDNPWSLEEV